MQETSLGDNNQSQRPVTAQVEDEGLDSTDEMIFDLREKERPQLATAPSNAAESARDDGSVQDDHEWMTSGPSSNLCTVSQQGGVTEIYTTIDPRLRTAMELSLQRTTATVRNRMALRYSQQHTTDSFISGDIVSLYIPLLDRPG